MSTAGRGTSAVGRITDEPIRLDDMGLDSGDGAGGAVVLFSGQVRAGNEGRQVVALEYDVYPEMAEAVLRDIAAEALIRFGVLSVEAIHRTGTLRVGEASVVIAVRSAHRSDAFDASRYVIEQIKVRLPVWKREMYADGTSRWLDGAPLQGNETGKATE